MNQSCQTRAAINGIKYGIYRQSGTTPLRGILYTYRSDAEYAMSLLIAEIGQRSRASIGLTVYAVDEVTLEVQYAQEETDRANELGRVEYDPHPITIIKSLPITPSY